MREKKEKLKCRWCGKSNGIIKFYIIADNLEEPKPYHPTCVKKLWWKALIKMRDINLKL